MLCEPLNGWRRYSFGPVWTEVMTWIEQQNAGTLPQTVNVAGCRIAVEDTQTRRLDCALYETHRRMIDVQVLLHGQEWMYVASADNLPLLDPFDETRDLGFHVTPACELGRLTLHPGMFALLFPWDAHMPLVAINDIPAPVRKLVAKIPLDALKL